MENIIIIAVLIIILGIAIGYMVRAKRRGTKCIGCPYGKKCTEKQKAAENCCCGKNK